MEKLLKIQIFLLITLNLFVVCILLVIFAVLAGLQPLSQECEDDPPAQVQPHKPAAMGV